MSTFEWPERRKQRKRQRHSLWRALKAYMGRSNIDRILEQNCSTNLLQDFVLKFIVSVSDAHFTLYYGIIFAEPKTNCKTIQNTKK